MRSTVIAGAVSLSLVGSAYADDAKPETELQAAIAGYDTAVSGIESHLAERFDQYTSERRERMLGDPVERYVFHVAQFDALSKAVNALGVDAANTQLKNMLSFSYWPARAKRYGVRPIYRDALGDSGGDPIATYALDGNGKVVPHKMALARLLCEPVAESVSAVANVAPLAASRNKLNAAATPSGLSGLSLLAHTLTNDYRIEPAAKVGEVEYDSGYYAALDVCVGDLVEAQAPFDSIVTNLPDAGDSEFIGGAQAFLTLYQAISKAIGGIATLIENRRMDRAIRDYIIDLEPMPDYPEMSSSLKRDVEKIAAENELVRQRNAAKIKAGANSQGAALKFEIEKENFIREAIQASKEDIHRLATADRILAARHYYIEFMMYKDVLNEITPGTKVRATRANGVPAMRLSSQLALTRSGTSSARYAAITKHHETAGLDVRETALLESASVYDAAYKAGEARAAIVVLEKAWGDLVKHAYEPREFGLESAIGLFKEITTASVGIKKALKTYNEEIAANRNARRAAKKEKND